MERSITDMQEDILVRADDNPQQIEGYNILTESSNVKLVNKAATRHHFLSDDSYSLSNVEEQL